MQRKTKSNIGKGKVRASLYKFFSVLVFVFLSPVGTHAAMSSTNYSIPIDSINFVSGDTSSANFNLNSTVGEVATGESTSTNYTMNAGFQQPDSCTISISDATNLSLAAIAGTGKSTLTNNYRILTITTNCSGGYGLYWKASTSNMISGANSISAYTPTGSDPEQWSVDASASEWGGHLNADSDRVDTDKWGEDTAPSYTSSETKWLNVATSDALIASYNSTTAGDDEKIYFGAEIGSSKHQISGNYSVTVTITAISQ